MTHSDGTQLSIPGRLGQHGRIGRRAVLGFGAVLPFSILLPPGVAAGSAPLVAGLDAAGLPSGLSPYGHAMHLHASDSEGKGSWSEQLRLTASLGIDYLWPSDHDWRLDGTNPRFVTGYDFSDGLSSGDVRWKEISSGGGAGSVDIVALSGSDAAHGDDALRLTVTKGSGSRGVKLSDKGGAFAGNVRGRSITGTVRIGSGVMVLTVGLSTHLVGSKSRPLSVSYVLGNVTRQDVKTSSSSYEVGVPTALGSWASFAVTPLNDIKRLWPQLESEDNAILKMSVEARGAGAELLLPRLGFPRAITGDAAVNSHNAMLARLAARNPAVLVGNALEYSWDGALGHASGFYANRTAPLLPPTYPFAHDRSYAAKVATQVHALGGVCSLNHPTGTSTTKGTARQQAKEATSSARKIIENAMYGVDVIEVGYRKRGTLGIDAYLLDLAGMVWRDGWFFTASGVSDDHDATEKNWFRNPGITHVWADGRSLAAQLSALTAGRVHVGMHDVYRGALWLGMNGAPMGSVQVNPATGSNTLTFAGTEIEAGWTVTIHRGPVDYPGASVSSSGVTVVKTLKGSDLAGGAASFSVDRPQSCYYLAVVRGPKDAIVGFTNPVWDLKSEKAGRPIPANRRV